jgi:hypothetical protein
MLESSAMVRAWLLATPSIAGLLQPQGVFCGGGFPEGFNPETSATDPTIGPGILITNVGTPAHPELLTVDSSRKQIKVAAGVNQALKAAQIYAAVHALMHGATNVPIAGKGFVMSSLEASGGQDVTDPDTGWATVLGFFQITAREL